MEMLTYSNEQDSLVTSTTSSILSTPLHSVALAALALASHGSPALVVGNAYGLPVGIVLHQHAASYTPPHGELEISEAQFFQAVDRIYEHLLRSPIELDEVAKRALYQNRWELYA